MVTKSDNTKGNPYHDDEGKFTKANGGGASTDNADEPRPNGLPSFMKKIDGKQPSFLKKIVEGQAASELFWDKLNKYKETLNNKNIEEMSDEELESEFKRHLEFFEKNNIKIEDSFKNIADVKFGCCNSRQLETLLNKYPLEILNGTSIKYEVDIFAPKSLGSTRANLEIKYIYKDGDAFDFSGSGVKTIFNGSKYINLNPIHFSSYDKAKDIKIKAALTGWSVEGEKDKYACMTLTHEFGHAVHNFLFKQFLKTQNPNGEAIADGGIEQVYNKQGKEYVDTIRKEVYNIYIQENPYIGYNEFKKMSSEYGSTNGSYEWFAETFASLNCGKPTKVAEALGKYLDKKLKKGE